MLKLWSARVGCVLCNITINYLLDGCEITVKCCCFFKSTKFLLRDVRLNIMYRSGSVVWEQFMFKCKQKLFYHHPLMCVAFGVD